MQIKEELSFFWGIKNKTHSTINKILLDIEAIYNRKHNHTALHPNLLSIIRESLNRIKGREQKYSEQEVNEISVFIDELENKNFELSKKDKKILEKIIYHLKSLSALLNQEINDAKNALSSYPNDVKLNIFLST